MLLVLWSFFTLTCGNSNYFWHCSSQVDFSTCFVSGASRAISSSFYAQCYSSEDPRGDLYRSLEPCLLSYFLPCVYLVPWPTQIPSSSFLTLGDCNLPAFLYPFAFTWQLSPKSKLGAIIGVTSFVSPRKGKGGFFFGGGGAPCLVICRILVPWPGIEPRPTALEVWSLNHWTTREVPVLSKQSLPCIACCPVSKDIVSRILLGLLK